MIELLARCILNLIIFSLPYLAAFRVTGLVSWSAQTRTEPRIDRIDRGWNNDDNVLDGMY